MKPLEWEKIITNEISSKKINLQNKKAVQIAQYQKNEQPS